MTKQLARVKIGITSRTAKQRRKGGDSGGDAKARFLLFVGGDDTDLDSAEVVARDGVCLMPVGFPARLPAGRIGHIAVRSGDMVRASKKNYTNIDAIDDGGGREGCSNYRKSHNIGV